MLKTNSILAVIFFVGEGVATSSSSEDSTTRGVLGVFFPLVLGGARRLTGSQNEVQ